jgi:hypothetical protein
MQGMKKTNKRNETFALIFYWHNQRILTVLTCKIAKAAAEYN